MSTRTPTSEFFQVGGTLHKDAPCYVLRPADHELFETIRRGGFCYVLTSRQMGKSSLMLRTTNRLREQGIATVILDLTRIGAHNVTVEQWYAGLLSEIGRTLDIRKDLLAYWRDNSLLPPTQRFFSALHDITLRLVPGQIVLFVDEVDAVRSLPFPADEFFAGIRECYNRRTDNPEMHRLIFGLFGVASPSDLIRDANVTPFNVGTRIELGDFSLSDAMVLAPALGKQGKALIERIFYWTNGHPYLTLRLCRALAEEGGDLSPTAVDRQVDQLFFGHHARETDDNLLFVRRWLLEGGANVAAMLDLYGKVWQGKTVPDETVNPLVEVLHLSGVVGTQRGRLHVRNRIYARVFDRKWILDHMPDAELRRQQDAYRRGVLRTATVSGLVILTMGILAVIATVNASEAKKQRDRADTLAKIAQQNLLKAKQTAEEVTVLAGRLAEMAGKVRQSDRSASELKSMKARLAQLTKSPVPVTPPMPPLVKASRTAAANAMEQPVARAEKSPTNPATPGAAPLPEAPEADKVAISAPTPASKQVRNNRMAAAIGALETIRERAGNGDVPPIRSLGLLRARRRLAGSTMTVDSGHTAASGETTGGLASGPLSSPDFDEQDDPIDRAKRYSPAMARSKPSWNPPDGSSVPVVFNIRVTINPDGSHTEEIIRGSGDPKLEQYVREYFSKWRWEPAKVDGQAVKAVKTIRLRIK